MWSQFEQTIGVLQLRPVQSLTVRVPSVPWVWFPTEGDPSKQEGRDTTYPLEEKQRTVSLRVAIEMLRNGHPMRCVAGPTGHINLGDSFYISHDGTPWFRWDGEKWQKILSLGVNSEELLDRLGRWAETSRWIEVSAPPTS